MRRTRSPKRSWECFEAHARPVITRHLRRTYSLVQVGEECGSPDLTRDALLRRSALAALLASGLYGLVDGLAPPRARAAIRLRHRPEQHVMQGIRIVRENGVEVVVPPRHHQIVTAMLQVGRDRRALRAARRELEHALAGLDRKFASTPAGLGTTVAWGRTYFRDFVPRLRHGRRFPHYLPVDLQASKRAGEPRPAILEAVRFPSDPASTRLEQNDVCVVFRSDSLAHIAAGARAVFDSLEGMFEITSIRKGFVGGGEDGGPSLPKQLALRAGLPAARLIPDKAQLFLGFTSTQRNALGPELIANFESLPGMTDQWPNGYFRGGTTMHVSHIDEDLDTWYASFSYIRRVWAAFNPGLAVPDGTLTIPEGPDDVQSESVVIAEANDKGLVGHSGSLQPANRLTDAVVDNHGVSYPRGTALIQRADFNTLDNPFFWSSHPTRDAMATEPAAGLHFVAFAATSDLFHRARLAMDGRYSAGHHSPFDPRSEEQGLNTVLRTTHRQNFLVPPRRHRSFPLSELL